MSFGKMAAAAVMLLCLPSCTKTTHKEWAERQDKYAAQHITKFRYEGHTYLLFQKGKDGVAITHDANCPCQPFPASVGEITEMYSTEIDTSKLTI